MGEEGHKSKFECSICHYIYDPDIGDEDKDIPAQTAFTDLPEDYTCPVCNSPKSYFVQLDIAD